MAARLYRETLKRCRHLGGERGQAARLDAKSFYKQFRATMEADAAEALLSSAQSRLSYLRMITPRFAGGKRLGCADASVDSTSISSRSYVVRDGVLQVRTVRPSYDCTRAGRLTCTAFPVRCSHGTASQQWARLPSRTGAEITLIPMW